MFCEEPIVLHYFWDNVGKVSIYITLTYFPTIKVHLFANKNGESNFCGLGEVT